MSDTLKTWQNLDFAQFQKSLDEQSATLTESQEEGQARRRTLATQTKAFRQLSDEEKLREVRNLLKGYQAEIDALTGRTKLAESNFMNVYKSLALLPDPAAMLTSQQAEIERLEKQVEKYNTSVPSDDDSRMARDLERQTLRVAQLEKQLKAATAPNGSRMAPTQHGDDGNMQSRIDELEAELSQRKTQLSEVQTQLKDQAVISERYQKEHQKAVKQLADQSDYEELKSANKSQELNGNDNDDQDVSSDAESVKVATEQRRLIQKLELQNSELKAERDELKEDLDQVRQLASKLEEDVSKMQGSDTFSTISGWTAVPRANSIRQGTAGGSQSGGSAVSGIIMQQRDRYKKRMQDLEEKLHTSESSLTRTKKELDTLKRESIRLQDRLRQLQPVGGVGNAQPPVGTLAGQVYEPTVEQKLKELDLDRRSIDLSPLQVKLVEGSARLLVDKNARTSAAVYVGALHLLVVLGFIF